MKKLIMMACTMAMMMAAPIAANASTVYLGNDKCYNYNGKCRIPGANGGYFVCTNDIHADAGCKTTFIEVTVTNGVSGGVGGSYSNPTELGYCTFSSCMCAYNAFLSDDGCTECKDQPKRTNTVATSDGSYHSKTSCDTCMPNMLGMAPAPGVIVCYCPENGTCADRKVTCNKGYYEVPGTSTSQTRCEACEDGATTSEAGATSHTECCYPSGTDNPFYDSTGTYYYKEKCCYTN